jgi:hypothetical protein
MVNEDPYPELRRLVTQMGRLLGTDQPPDFDSRQGATFAAANGVEVHLRHNEPEKRLLFLAELGAVPAANEAHLAKEMLRANLVWEYTRGATLGLMDVEDAPGPAAFLSKEVSWSAFPPAELLAELNQFALTAGFWRERFSRAAKESPAADHRPFESSAFQEMA